ncbi:MAG: segregation and condensation protein A [Candidatus Limnocylindrales bacterium]
MLEAAVRAVPTVEFGEGRGPEASTRIRLPDFDGPLGLLLALIESERLDILTVPLGALAGAYLEALAGLEDDRLANISAFVGVASQLIVIKSRALLPRRDPRPAEGPALDEGPDPEAELRARLILYRAFRDAGTVLADRAAAIGRLFRREPGLAHASALAGAAPSDAPPLDPALLVAALADLISVVPPPPPPPGTLRRAVSIAERSAVIRAAIRDAGSIVLQDLLRDGRDRVVAAVTFLALLELVKRREVVVEQTVPWGPIVVRPIGDPR